MASGTRPLSSCMNRKMHGVTNAFGTPIVLGATLSTMVPCLASVPSRDTVHPAG